MDLPEGMVDAGDITDDILATLDDTLLPCNVSETSTVTSGTSTITSGSSSHSQRRPASQVASGSEAVGPTPAAAIIAATSKPDTSRPSYQRNLPSMPGSSTLSADMGYSRAEQRLEGISAQMWQQQQQAAQQQQQLEQQQMWQQQQAAQYQQQQQQALHHQQRLDQLQRDQQAQMSAYWHQQQMLAGQNGVPPPHATMASQLPHAQYYGTPYTDAPPAYARWAGGQLPPTTMMAASVGSLSLSPQAPPPLQRTSGELAVQAPDNSSAASSPNVKSSEV